MLRFAFDSREPSDNLALGAQARMNLPGSYDIALGERIRSLARLYGR